jgi:hypothetical protein
MGLANDGGCDHGAILAERHGNGLESADACHMNDLVNERMKGVAMGLFTNLVLGLVHLLLVAVDLLFVLLLARMLSFRWHTPLAGGHQHSGPAVSRLAYPADREDLGPCRPESAL